MPVSLLSNILRNADRDAASLQSLDETDVEFEPRRKLKSVKFQLPQSRKKPGFLTRVDRPPSQLYTLTTRNVYLSGQGINPHALGNMYQVEY